MLGGADFGRGDALVQTAVVGDDGADVEVRDDVTVHGHVLSHLQPVAVGQLLAVQLPGDFGCRVARRHALQEHRRTGLESFFGECLSQLRWLNCEIDRVF